MLGVYRRNCPCETGPQTPEHVLCRTILPHIQGSSDTALVPRGGATLAEKLWDSKQDLVQATNFTNTVKLHVRVRNILER